MSEVSNTRLFEARYYSRVAFIDMMPAVYFAPHRSWSFSGGPYASVAVAQSRTVEELRQETDLHRSDFGLHGGVEYQLGRCAFLARYQLSLRNYDLSDFTAVHPESDLPNGSSQVSVLSIGFGFTLLR